MNDWWNGEGGGSLLHSVVLRREHYYAAAALVAVGDSIRWNEQAPQQQQLRSARAHADAPQPHPKAFVVVRHGRHNARDVPQLRPLLRCRCCCAVVAGALPRAAAADGSDAAA